MSILLYNYKQLTECISEFEQIEAKVNNSKKRLTKRQEKEEVPTTLDSHFINNKIAESK
jgi:hypothetical protein